MSMKKSVLLGLLVLSLSGYAQTADELRVADTRNNNEPPSFYDKEFRVEFKDRTAMNAPGLGTYSGMLTFAPWSNSSGGHSYQLNFNDGGIYYRKGLADDPSWGNWMQLITTNVNGNVGIGVSTALAKLHVEGDALLKGPIWIETNSDPVLTFNNTDDSWQYIQFRANGIRNAWMGISNANDFTIGKENGGDIALMGGNVGIGTTAPGTYKLAVEGKIGARSVKVTTANWADYVFAPTYNLMSLPETEAYIRENQHLPNIPSAAEVKANGFHLEEMDAKLLAKIEELMLYTIEQQKSIVELKLRIEELESQKR